VGRESEKYKIWKKEDILQIMGKSKRMHTCKIWKIKAKCERRGRKCARGWPVTPLKREK
jgi:hypothetical protein